MKNEQCEGCGELTATLWKMGTQGLCGFCLSDRQDKREVYVLDPSGNPVLEVVCTDEGVIMDCYDGVEHVGTFAMMANELYDFVITNDPMNNISE